MGMSWENGTSGHSTGLYPPLAPVASLSWRYEPLNTQKDPALEGKHVNVPHDKAV